MPSVMGVPSWKGEYNDRRRLACSESVSRSLLITSYSYGDNRFH